VLKPIPSGIDEQRLIFKDHKCRREQGFIFIHQIRPEVSILRVIISSTSKPVIILTPRLALMEDTCYLNT